MAKMFVAYLNGFQDRVGVSEIVGEEAQSERREWCSDEGANEFIGETPQEAVENMIHHYFSRGRELMDDANHMMKLCDVAMSARNCLPNIKIEKIGAVDIVSGGDTDE